jgi:hypothetical protein
MILHMRTLEEVQAAKLRLMGYYQRSGQFNPENRAALQGILEALKWVCNEAGPNSRISQLLEGFRLPESEVPQIKPPTGG